MIAETHDFLAGDQYFRPNAHRYAGGVTPEHDHDFPHAVIVVAGWYMLQLHAEDGSVEGEWQLASVEHANLRRVMGVNSPGFIKGREVPFAPIGYWGEVLPLRRHSMVALADNSAFCCTYSYRDPNTGGKVQEWNGWMGAVE